MAFAPLVPRALFSTAAGDGSLQQQQQRNGSDLESGEGENGRQGTVGEEVERKAEETFLVTRLGLKSLDT